MHNQAEKLGALLETTKAITSELDLTEVLKLILQRGKELTHADTGALLLVDKDQKRWTKKLIGPHKDDEYGHTIDEGITGWVARNKEPLLVPDVSLEDIYIPWTPKTKSELAVPILYSGNLVGVLNVESFKGGAFEQSDCELLEALAGHAAIAIENARLYEDLNKQVRITESLHRVGAGITAKAELSPVLREITKGLNKIVEADIPLVYLYDQGKDEFIDIYYGDISEEWRECEPRAEAGAGFIAIKEKHIVVAHEDDKKGPGISVFAQKKGVKTTCAIPLLEWFSIDAELEDEFNKRIITVKLKDIFETNGYPLSDNAFVSKEKENKWILTDEEKFIVRKEYGMLNVYPPISGNDAICAMYLHFLGAKHYLKDEEKRGLYLLAKRTRNIIKETMKEIDFYQGSNEKMDALKEKIAEKINKEKIVEKIDELSKADILLMYLYDPKKNDWISIIYAGLSKEWGAQCKPREGGAGKTAIKIKGLVTAYENPKESYPEEGLGINPYPKEKGAKTTAAYPLFFEDKTLGVFYMHFLERHEFTEEEKKAIATLGAHAAIVLDRVKTYQSLKKLADVERDITSDLSLEETAKHIAEAIEGITGGGIPNIFLYDSKNESLDFLACSGAREELLLGKFTPREDGLGARVIEKVKKGEYPDYLIIEDVQNDPQHENPSPSAKNYGIKTSACFPLKFGNRPLGALYLHFMKTRHFSEDEIRAFSHFADQTAIAIENARRFEIIQKTNEELSANVMAWLGIVGSTWQHEIIQGIFAIETGIATLESYLPATYPDEIKATLEAINKDIQETKGAQPDFPHDDVMRSVNLNSVIDASVKKLKNRIEDKKIKLRLDLDEEIPSVKASHAWLEVVFNILIDNAIRAMADEGKLTFSSKVEEDGVKVEITDTGTGIPETIQKQLFKKRIGGARGFGVGLLLAKIILGRYRGDIKLSSTGPGGTTFALILPVETKTR